MTTPAANAAPVQSSDVLSTLEQVSSESVPNGLAPMVANSPIEDIATTGESVDVEAGNSIVTIPSDTSLPIEMQDKDGTFISLTLPQAQTGALPSRSVMASLPTIIPTAPTLFRSSKTMAASR
ncbi:hypothetical protein ACX80E_11035 [Arthrobacter sp. TMN-49]